MVGFQAPLVPLVPPSMRPTKVPLTYLPSLFAQLPCWEGLPQPVMTNQLTGDFEGKPRRVAYLHGPEVNLESVLVPRLHVAGADMSRIVFPHWDDPSMRWTFPQNLESLDAFLEEEKEVGLVIADPLGSFIPRLTQVDQARAAMDGLTQLTAQHGVGMVMPHHFIKSGTSIDTAIGGAAAIKDTARAIHLFGEPVPTGWKLLGLLFGNTLPRPEVVNEDSDEDSGRAIRILATHISNLGPVPDSTEWEILLEPLRELHHEVPRLKYLRVGDTGAVDLFKWGQATEITNLPAAVKEAVEFILNCLVNGPIRSTDLIAQAKENGIKERTLDRARQRLTQERTLTRRNGDAALGEDPSAWYVELIVPDYPPEVGP